MNFEHIPMDDSWKNKLSLEFQKPYMIELNRLLLKEIASNTPVYPPKDLIFNALKLTPLHCIKVVIIGQDPYHGPGQAEGLCFSVPPNIKPPPSLQNIFKQLQSEFNIPRSKNGSLVYLAKQGVLLLNTTLTVREGQPKSHFGKGWEMFTDKIVEIVCEKTTPLVFLLWGNSAIDKLKQTKKSPNHLVLTAPHPSPLSAYTGFLGCQHFSKTNAFLRSHHLAEINWRPPSES